MNNSFNLDQPLLTFSDQFGETSWTIRNAVEGLQIFGGIGSGKTSGSGKTIALKYLKAGFGGLVLTVKPTDKEDWIGYCRTAGRSDDLIIVEPGGKYAFDFMDYEAKHTPAESSVSQNLVQLLKTVINADGKQNGSGEDSFWEQALDTLIGNTIDLCLLAHGKVTIPLLYDIVITIDKILPKENNEADSKKTPSAYTLAMQLAEKNVSGKVNVWMESQDKTQLAKLSVPDLNKLLGRAVPESRLLLLVRRFFLDNYVTLSPKTRSVIDYKFLGFLNQLIREPAFSLFCDRETNFTPEDSLDGKVILLNLPVKLYHDVGKNCQILFKYIWQRAMEKRDIEKNGRPCLLWCDESQETLHDHDAACQATARSSRIATVYLSQNINNYFVNMGGSKPEYRVKAFLGTLATKIFHANADVETNEYASKLIGEGNKIDFTQQDVLAKEPSTSMSMKLELKRRVRPENFTELRTGSKQHNSIVEAYIHTQGKSSGSLFNFKKIAFTQNSNS
jgi:hypothetical protein